MSVCFLTYIDPKPEYQLEYLYFTHSAAVNAPFAKVLAFHPPSCPPPPRGNVVPIPWVPLSERDALYKHHPFINSIACIAENPEALAGFTHAVRTDTDCFILPGFPSIPLPTGKLLNRGASYAFKPQVQQQIAQHCEKVLGCPHLVSNCGPTIYSEAAAVLTVCRDAMQVARTILEDFAKEPGEWPKGTFPYWFSGVTSMYACEAGINSALHSLNLNYTPTNLLDCHSDSCEDMLETFGHAHCYHSYLPFSKFSARQGDYAKGLRNASTEPIGGARLQAPIPQHIFRLFRDSVQNTPFAHLAE